MPCRQVFEPVVQSGRLAGLFRLLCARRACTPKPNLGSLLLSVGTKSIFQSRTRQGTSENHPQQAYLGAECTPCGQIISHLGRVSDSSFVGRPRLRRCPTYESIVQNADEGPAPTACGFFSARSFHWRCSMLSLPVWPAGLRAVLSWKALFQPDPLH